MKNILPIIDNTQSELIFGMGVIILILLTLLFFTMINLSIFKSNYKKLNKSKQGFSYDEHILNNKKEIEFLKKIQNDSLSRIDQIDGQLLKTYTKMSLHRYNAFDNQGGQLSFILILLNENRDGIILNNLHNNDFTYLYAKKVTRGATDEVLSKEEKTLLLQTLEK